MTCSSADRLLDSLQIITSYLRTIAMERRSRPRPINSHRPKNSSIEGVIVNNERKSFKRKKPLAEPDSGEHRLTSICCVLYLLIHRAREGSPVLEPVGPADPEERSDAAETQHKQSKEPDPFPWRWWVRVFKKKKIYKRLQMKWHEVQSHLNTVWTKWAHQ